MMLPWLSSCARERELGYETRVGHETSGIGEGGLGVFELGQSFLEFHVEIHGPGDGPDCARTHAVCFDRR